MFCTKCGSEISDAAAVCPHCGLPTAEPQKSDATAKEYPFLLGFVSFVFPLVGFILMIVYWKSKPISARMCLRGTIVGILFMVCAVLCLPQVILLARNLTVHESYVGAMTCAVVF